jgi:hypothetical protein
MNRRESVYPKTIVEKVQNFSSTATVSKSCKWGRENESNALLKYYEQKIFPYKFVDLLVW